MATAQSIAYRAAIARALLESSAANVGRKFGVELSKCTIGGRYLRESPALENADLLERLAAFLRDIDRATDADQDAPAAPVKSEIPDKTGDLTPVHITEPLPA